MSNILRPNLYGIGTTSTPEWIVSSGMVAKVTDASGEQTIVIAQGGKLDLDGALGGNMIVLQGLVSSQVSVFRSGTEVRFKLLSTGETFLSLPATSTLQNLRFTDGDKSLQIVSGAPKFAGNTVSTETSAPSLLSAGVAGAELQLVFNEEMSGGSLPLASAFQIAINGVALASTEYSVASGEGDTVRISLPASAATAASVSVSYADPTTANDTRALQDINGNDVASFGPSAAVRNPADTRAPVLLVAATNADGSRIALEFNEDIPAGALAANRFAVSVAGAGVSVASASVAGKVVELTLAPAAISSGQAVQLSYTGAAGSADAVRDAAGNAAANWTAWSVSNEVLGAAPVLAKATNILRPNLYGIETAQTPNWKISAGMVAKVTDASGAQMFTVARGGKLDLDGAIGSNVIALEGRNSSEVEVYRSGTEVRFRLLESGETILSIPATSTAQTLRFVNADKVLQIVTGAPRFDGVAVTVDTAAPVCERATISGTELRLVFGEELNGAKLPPASALTITVNGQTLTASQFTIQGVEGKQLVVALAQAVTEGSAVTVVYADPTTVNDDLALQDINGNDSASFGPIQAVAPVMKFVLDDEVPAGGPGNAVSLSVAAQAFHLIEDFARTSNFEVSGFGVDDKIELTNLPAPGMLSISTEGSAVTFTVNADGGITSQVTLLGVVPEGAIVYNPASFNELAVGDLLGVDVTRPVFAAGASRTVSVVEGQAQLVTASTTDSSGVSYGLQGADAALLQVSSTGVVSLKTGLLDYDAASAKRLYSFNVIASDPFGNDQSQAVTVSVTNDPADDVAPPNVPSVSALAAPNTVTEGSSMSFLVSLTGPAPTGGYTVDWRVVLPIVGNPAQAADFGFASPYTVLPSGSVVVPAGQSSVQFPVPVFDDTLSEGDEVFALQVGRVGATPSDPFNSMFQHIAVIEASDQAPGPDTTPPALTISSTTTKILAGNSVNVSFQFSEPVTGFDLSDVAVSNGSLNTLYKGSDTYYSAQFQPTAGVDGTAIFSVVAGRFADAVGNANTASASLSIPLATVQPGNSGITAFTTPTTGTSDILVRFSEPIFEVNAGAQMVGFGLARNPSSGNDFQGSGTAPQITGFTLGEGAATGGYLLLTLRTNTAFNADDVVRVSIDGSANSFRDADGNRLAGQDVYVGGDNNNTIDLERHWSSARQIVRGNGGNDTLTGTDNADSLVDGGGADLLRGGRDGDFYGMVENGASRPYARDTVAIGLGDARRGYTTTDLIRWDGTDNNSGFDWFSSTFSNHDMLALPSALVVVDTPAPGSTVASGFAAALAAQGALAGHTVSGGIVTFKDSAGAPIAITQATNLGNALDYLSANLKAPGYTAAFKVDYDNNGSAESLIVYQDSGTVPLASNAELPDIVVRIEQALASRLDGVSLGNAAGANVLQVVDGFAPNPITVGLATNGVVLNFAEPMFAPTTVANLAMSLQVNGAGTVYTPANVSGVGTSALLVQCAGLASAQLALGVTDWALVTYAGTDANNALRDASGQLLIAGGDNGVPQAHTFALGSSGNNVIDLSTRQAVAGRGLDIEAAGGDDVVKGTVGDDQIVGGAGSDAMTGGQGADSYDFSQGDSPALTFNLNGADPYVLIGATYSFAGSKAEVITDFGAGDTIYLNPPLDGLTGAAWLNGLYSASEIGMNGGLAADQRFFAVQGSLNVASGVFTVGANGTAGADTLVVYDGDGSGSVSQTGFVLQGVVLGQLSGLYQGDGTIRSTVSPVSTTTKIDWTVDQNGPGMGQGDDLNVQVHFTNPVVVSGTPQMALVITNDAGQSRTVQASFVPYSGVSAGGPQSSMQFSYSIAASDTGRFHIDSISLNGGSIVEFGQGGLAADLTLNSDNRTITVGTYLYGTPVMGLVGTAGNDALVPYEADPANAPTNGVFTGVDGGAGDRDALVIPVLLPASVTTAEAAAGYTLKYNAASGASAAAVTAVSSSGTVAATVNVAFPTGVEALYFHAVYRDGSASYQDADISAVTLSKNLVTVTDAVVGTERFVQGTPGADTINLSTDTNADSRYLIRGGPGGDTITGSAGRDAVRGDGGSNSINAGPGNDAIFVGGGSDTADGGSGTDKVVATLPGQMLAIGSRISGFALQSLTGTWETNGFTVGSTSNAYRIQTDDSGTLFVRNFSDNSLAMSATNVEAIEVRLNQSDARSAIPLILGSADATGDTLAGTGMSIVSGRAGNDTLNASNLGDDVLVGGSGNDTLNGGSARDLMYGGSGDDAMTGHASGDWFVGDAGNDVISGGEGSDGAGFIVTNVDSATAMIFSWDATANAVLVKQGTAALAKISAGASGAWVVTDLASTAATTFFGTDTLNSVESLTFEFATGTTSSSARTITSAQLALMVPSAAGGTTVANLIIGTSGNESLSGTAGNDSIVGLAGNDALDGGAGVDTAGFSGAFADYTVLIETAGIRITDKVANRDGADLLVNVERFVFTDGGYSVNAAGTGLGFLNPAAAKVLDVAQGAGYTDAVNPATLSDAQLAANLADWIDGSTPLLVSQVASRSLAVIDGPGDDNELKYGLEFTPGAAGGSGTTTMFMRVDQNPLDGQIQPSSLIEFTFPGDVRASLVPDSLTYSG